MTILGIDPSLTATGVSDGGRHAVIATVAVDGETQEQNLLRRSSEIAHAIQAFIEKHCGGNVDALYVESPSYSSTGHLHEMGWILCRLHHFFDHVKIVMVPPGTWRKALFGNGQIAKERIALAAYKKFQIEIDGDSGLNMLEAFLLCKYGEMAERGDLQHAVSRRRGQKRKKAA